MTGRGWLWQAARVETESISVGELLNDPANVRQHGARNLETIKASLARFGQQKPIVVDGNGVVVAGNGTLAAARELGWQSVHVVRSGLTGSDRTAYAIADNRTAELAEWDDAALAEQLSALAIDDAELLAAAGYDPGELEKLVGAFDIDACELPEEMTTNSGFETITFNLTSEQAEVVREAIGSAKVSDGYATEVGDGNSNGGAIALVCRVYCAS